ncbi:TobH protein [Mycolicibacterium sp. CH28]|uniref:TobH protein n=1 Tax=Mycolicibacterium sp. CH28 TaxID=2512237 RepID=UPI001081C2D8|nr:TobH protein [Mycolicibacterium sp. CH28]TGD86857.1 TobH protein [Mycolicibacterium sp. CH28]
MSAAHATVDLDDTEGLLDADRDGLLRAAATAGAQVRATAAAVAEGELASVTGGHRPRTVIWVGGRGAAESAGTILAATLGGLAGEPIVVAAQSPPWIGPLDVLVVAGDDAGDPALVTAAATAVRRGARVVVAAPYEGPLRDATAGRTAVLAPRIWAPDEFGLCRYLAAGLATLQAVDPAVQTDLAGLADELDAEALRNSAGREVLTNPAKALAERMSRRQVVLAGDCAATLGLARHAAAVLLRLAGHAVAAAGLADALVALRGGMANQFGDPVDALFHDEELDGPLPGRPRVLALALAAERSLVAARVSGLDDVDLVGAEDVGDIGSGPAAVGGTEQQLATLAVRLQMAAVYLRLVGG